MNKKKFEFIKTCKYCGFEIDVNLDDVSGIIKYDDKYYHCDCFNHLCNDKLNNKRANHDKWNEAINNIKVIEHDTSESIMQAKYRFDFDKYLIECYEIAEIPTYFRVKINNIIGRKCKGTLITIEVLFEAWKAQQSKLDEINKSLKVKGNAPDGTNRLNYDLAVVINNMSEYLNQLKEEKIMVDKYNREAEEYFANMY